MRGVIVEPAGLRLTDLPAPGRPGPGEALIDVHAVSLNYRDLLVARGRYGTPSEKPFIAGSDMAGVAAEVGPGVQGLAPGDRVVNTPFRHWPAGRMRPEWMRTFIGAGGVDGILAERILFPAAALAPMPSHFSFHEGATLPIAGLTAWAAVVVHGRAQPGEWVLLHGTGGVSIFAAQLARLAGARTLLTTSSAEKGRLVKERYGVLETFDYRDEAWSQQVRDYTGGEGVDLVVEVAGGKTFSQSLKACAYHARVSLIGVLAGYESTFNPFDIIRRQLTVRGIYMESAQELHRFVRACETSGLRPCIDRVFPFDQTPDAYAYLESRKHIGKIVIEVQP